MEAGIALFSSVMKGLILGIKLCCTAPIPLLQNSALLLQCCLHESGFFHFLFYLFKAHFPYAVPRTPHSKMKLPEDKEITNSVIPPQTYLTSVKGKGFYIFCGLRNTQAFVIEISCVNHTAF